MWFFGISTENPRNFWMIGAVVLAIIVTIFVRKWAAHLMTMSEEEEDESLKGDCKIEGENKCKEIVEKKCDHCLPGNYCIRTYGLEELKMATRDFKIKIGVGATSFVYLAELGDGTFGAVKRVMEEKGGSKKVFLNEVSVLLRISHPNLVGLMGFCLDKGEQLLLLEYVPNRSLFDRMHTRHGQSSGILSWSNRVSIALDIARVLEYLHSVADPPVIHRDVKSSNILLIDDNQAKLADFGLCKLGHDSSSVQTPTTIKGSLGYVDINYLNTGVVTPMSDVYSFGVLLLELITGLKSVQGSETLAEWTEEYRKNDQMEVSIGMLDPKLKGEADVGQLRVLIDVANSALLDYCEDRPDMAQIVHRISTCMNPQLQLDLPV